MKPYVQVAKGLSWLVFGGPEVEAYEEHLLNSLAEHIVAWLCAEYETR